MYEDAERAMGCITIFMLVGVFVITAGIGYVAGAKHVAYKAMDDAVMHGKAEYFLDANNQKQWRWKP